MSIQRLTKSYRAFSKVSTGSGYHSQRQRTKAGGVPQTQGLSGWTLQTYCLFV